jgi:hypothetical protein
VLALDAEEIRRERVDELRLDRVLDDGEAVAGDPLEVPLRGRGVDRRVLPAPDVRRPSAAARRSSP